jgi:uncharacterized RDD family membrane protein YckC
MKHVLVPAMLIAALTVPLAAQPPARPPVRTGPQVIAPVEAEQNRPAEVFLIRSRTVLKIWQDYELKAGDVARNAVVISGNATIDGRVAGDLVVVLGDVRLGSTAVVEGTLVVTAGNATIASGAEVRQDLVVVGGILTAPPGFAPRGEHVAIGNAWLAERVRALVPWLTRGLLWGRLIVADLPWVWGVVAFFFIVSLVIALLLHEPVGRCAETLTVKPFSTFFVGLLTLLLAGPVSVLLAASIIGLVVVPFLWCALLLAWTIGKVGVARWLGRAILGRRDPETRLEGLQSFVIGAVVIYLLYWVPLVGLVTWALVGVLGLGAATLTFVAAVRRERPRAPAPTQPTAPPSPPAPPPAPLVPPLPPEPAIGGAATAFSSLGEPPPRVTSAGAAAIAPGGDLSLLPKASFLDRLAAFTLDAVLILLAVAMLNLRQDGGPFFVLFLGYCVAFWTWRGTTIGGIVCNLQVIRTNGQAVRFPDALVRALSSLFSFAALGLGVLWILRDDDRQAWHDKIAGTFVVRVPKAWALI